ncbi:hypothetical protein H6P81_006738 [Aristolochia fimbriata]|uniref:PGG domain-containing protein n=1 Tax=Aristolochia fimbriata TaxID=158543 RepID=A0AAV7EZI2_ARIFI|nr:hypothetical protein H6P81_006738 [Aristolochia fimbriata]
METQPSFRRKKMTKQLTGKRDDTPLHGAARAGNLKAIMDVLTETEEPELKELLSKQNQSGETPLYVAADYGYADLVREMIKYHDSTTASIKAKNGYDAFHIAARQGDIETVKELITALPQLSMTVDLSNTTALHTAAALGHGEVVNLILEMDSSLAKIARSNGKTALHSAARNGHLDIVRALLSKEPATLARTDKKGQTAFHMAAKGQSLEVLDELLKHQPSMINMVDTKGNTALHITSRKGRQQIARKLLEIKGISTNCINRAGETPIDTAEKIGNLDIMEMLREYGVPSAKTMAKPAAAASSARELKQTVSDIKHEVHSQMEHTRQTRRRVQGIAKRLNKLHAEGLNNAINSTTVVAVLIATVAFAGIFTVPGEYLEDPATLPPGHSLGEANIAPTTPFLIFFMFDSVALFISLAVVVVQTSIVVIESKAKKQMMAIMNKLMWLACVLISVAFLALSFVVAGQEGRWLAITVTCIGTTIMATTLGTMCYWVIMHRIEASNFRNIKKTESSNRSRSWSMSVMSDSDLNPPEFKRMYAI